LALFAHFLYQFQQLANCPVQVAFRDPARLYTLKDAIDAILPDRGHFQVRAAGDGAGTVVHAAPIGHKQAFKTPLFASDFGQQLRVFAGVGAVELVVGTHHGPGLRLADDDLKRPQEDLAQSALIDDRVIDHPAEFLVVGSEVFQADARALALDAVDVGTCQFPCHEGIFGKVLKVAPVEGVALDVHAWCQQDVHLSGFGFRAKRLPKLKHQLPVKRTGYSGKAGIAGGGIAPLQSGLTRFGNRFSQSVGTVVQRQGRNAQPWDGTRVPKVPSA